MSTLINGNFKKITNSFDLIQSFKSKVKRKQKKNKNGRKKKETGPNQSGPFLSLSSLLSSLSLSRVGRPSQAPQPSMAQPAKSHDRPMWPSPPRSERPPGRTGVLHVPNLLPKISRFVAFAKSFRLQTPPINTQRPRTPFSPKTLTSNSKLRFQISFSSSTCHGWSFARMPILPSRELQISSISFHPDKDHHFSSSTAGEFRVAKFQI